MIEPPHDRVGGLVARVLAGANLLRDTFTIGVFAEEFHEQPGTGDQVVRRVGEHVVEAVLTGCETQSHAVLLECGNKPQRIVDVTQRPSAIILSSPTLPLDPPVHTRSRRSMSLLYDSLVQTGLQSTGQVAPGA